LGAREEVQQSLETNTYRRIEDRARAACSKIGEKFMASYPVAKLKADELEWAFLDNYDQALPKWAAAHPQWAHGLQEAAAGLELQSHLNSSLSRPSLVA
jgi:hypothetical protein